MTVKTRTTLSVGDLRIELDWSMPEPFLVVIDNGDGAGCVCRLALNDAKELVKRLDDILSVGDA